MSVADLYWALAMAKDVSYAPDIQRALVDQDFTFDIEEMRGALRSALIDAVIREGQDAVNRTRRIKLAQTRKRSGESDDA